MLWLASIRNSCPDDVQARLLPCLQQSVVTDLDYAAEVLAVYTNDANHATKEVRQTLVAIRAEYVAGAAEWVLRPGTNHPAAQINRLCRIIGGTSRTCQYAAFGDSYLYAVLSARCETWRTALCVHPRPPYEPMTSQYGDKTNDEVRPFLDVPVKTVLAKHDLRVPGCSIQILAAACATLSEICNADGPVVYVDCHIAHALARKVPSVCILTDDFQAQVGAPGSIGVHFNGRVTFSPGCSVADFMIGWLELASKDALPGSTLWELSRFIFGNIPGSLSNRVCSNPPALPKGQDDPVGEAPHERHDGGDLLAVDEPG